MKKALTIFAVFFGFILLIIVSFSVGVFANRKTISVGRILITENNNHILIKDNTPIVLSNLLEDPSLFDGVTNGDLVFVVHDGVAESYPAQSGATVVMKIKDGNDADIPQNVINELSEFGWAGQQDVVVDQAGTPTNQS